MDLKIKRSSLVFGSKAFVKGNDICTYLNACLSLEVSQV